MPEAVDKVTYQLNDKAALGRHAGKGHTLQLSVSTYHNIALPLIRDDVKGLCESWHLPG
jgi:hypothetical protein